MSGDLVPEPLVLEVHLPSDVRLSQVWAIAVVEDGAVVELSTT